MNKSTAVILSFAAGVLAGAAVGILYAPEDGKNTRNKLSFRLSKYRDQLKTIIDSLMEHEDHSFNAAKTEGQKVIKETKDQAEKLLSDVEGLINQIKGTQAK